MAFIPHDQSVTDLTKSDEHSNAHVFLISVTPITFAQWDACVDAGGCSYKPSDFDWGRADRPVIDVSWLDVQEYVAWLSDITGLDYRLPTQTEWEYAARAGTEERFLFGDCLSTDQANFAGPLPAQGCPAGEWRQRTVPVASFEPNTWGLFDIHGNVWEWQADCVQRSTSASSHEETCRSAMLQGGAWTSNGDALDLSSGIMRAVDSRRDDAGFRVVRSVSN